MAKIRSGDAEREIAELRSRLFMQDWHIAQYLAQFRLMSLRRLIGTSLGDELHRHVIVGAIAALETFHRGVIVGIVDSSDDYKARAAESVTERISMGDALKWFGGESVKFSELVAHSAPFSSVTDLVSWLGRLLGCNLKKEVEDAVPPVERRNGTESAAHIVSNVDDLLSALGEAFRLRHIFAHEAASDLVVSAAECDRLLASIEQWMNAIDAVLWATVRADLPLTGSEMNQQASRELKTARRELASAMRGARVTARKAGTASWLRSNHVGWMRIMREWLDGAYGGRLGTRWPLEYMGSFAEAIRKRAAEVTNWAKSVS